MSLERAQGVALRSELGHAVLALELEVLAGLKPYEPYIWPVEVSLGACGGSRWWVGDSRSGRAGPSFPSSDSGVLRNA